MVLSLLQRHSLGSAAPLPRSDSDQRAAMAPDLPKSEGRCAGASLTVGAVEAGLRRCPRIQGKLGSGSADAAITERSQRRLVLMSLVMVLLSCVGPFWPLMQDCWLMRRVFGRLVKDLGHFRARNSLPGVG